MKWKRKKKKVNSVILPSKMCVCMCIYHTIYVLIISMPCAPPYTYPTHTHTHTHHTIPQPASSTHTHTNTIPHTPARCLKHVLAVPPTGWCTAVAATGFMGVWG